MCIESQSDGFPFRRETLLQERVGSRIRCNICERRCLISDGECGWCQTRQNDSGSLVTLTYGAVSSMMANPIEKKPFYHFWPGTGAFTVGSWMCNFGCPWCQNWTISKTIPAGQNHYVLPEAFIGTAEASGCSGISISFNEPTLSLEWSLDVFHLARERGLYNTLVTNGYMTPEALDQLVEAGLDAMNIDIKGDAEAVMKYCQGIKVDKIWDVSKNALSRGVHVEITTLVIPTVNDNDAVLQGIAQRIAAELGPDTPWHINAYFPDYQFNAPPTPIDIMERAWLIGKSARLEFVYTGNLPASNHENTHCPRCGTLLVRREKLIVLDNKILAGHCPQCGCSIAGIWTKGKPWNSEMW